MVLVVNLGGGENPLEGDGDPLGAGSPQLLIPPDCCVFVFVFHCWAMSSCQLVICFYKFFIFFTKKYLYLFGEVQLAGLAFSRSTNGILSPALF